MLELDAVNAGYGRAQVLRDLSLKVEAGEILCLLGRNGAGKTTTMQAIMGLLPLMSGRVVLDGTDVSQLPPHEVPRHGIGYIPQGRRLFSGLTVAQNLEIGLRVRGSGKDVQEEVLDLFPRLRERMDQKAQTLSGGEQQMLATARALCLRPKALLLDEPTEGLQPSMIEAIRQVIVRMRAAGVAILLVEQRVDAVLPIADRVAFMNHGEIKARFDIEEVRSDKSLLHQYVGVGA